MLKRVLTRRATRTRKGKRETTHAQAVEFKDYCVDLAHDRNLDIPPRLLKELNHACQLKDGSRRLYKLDLRKSGILDCHVILIADILKELPVVRKLDLRGNLITPKGARALVSTMQDQLIRFRSMKAVGAFDEPSGKTTFLYSAKLDNITDPCMDDLHQYSILLEVADAVTDIHTAFSNTDITNSGVLSRKQMAIAYQEVLGSSASSKELDAIIDDFGMKGYNVERISIDGFEKAMIQRLRDRGSIAYLGARQTNFLLGNEDTLSTPRESSQLVQDLLTPTQYTRAAYWPETPSNYSENGSIYDQPSMWPSPSIHQQSFSRGHSQQSSREYTPPLADRNSSRRFSSERLQVNLGISTLVHTDTFRSLQNGALKRIVSEKPKNHTPLPWKNLKVDTKQNVHSPSNLLQRSDACSEPNGEIDMKKQDNLTDAKNNSEKQGKELEIREKTLIEDDQISLSTSEWASKSPAYHWSRTLNSRSPVHDDIPIGRNLTPSPTCSNKIPNFYQSKCFSFNGRTQLENTSPKNKTTCTDCSHTVQEADQSNENLKVPFQQSFKSDDLVCQSTVLPSSLPNQNSTSGRKTPNKKEKRHSLSPTSGWGRLHQISSNMKHRDVGSKSPSSNEHSKQSFKSIENFILPSSKNSSPRKCVGTAEGENMKSAQPKSNIFTSGSGWKGIQLRSSTSNTVKVSEEISLPTTETYRWNILKNKEEKFKVQLPLETDMLNQAFEEYTLILVRSLLAQNTPLIRKPGCLSAMQIKQRHQSLKKVTSGEILPSVETYKNEDLKLECLGTAPLGKNTPSNDPLAEERRLLASKLCHIDPNFEKLDFSELEAVHKDIPDYQGEFSNCIKIQIPESQSQSTGICTSKFKVENGELKISSGGNLHVGLELLEQRLGETYPEEISRVHTLTMNHCQLQNIESASLLELPYIKNLDVSFNFLTKMELIGPQGGLERLPRSLERLNLSNNQILKVGGLGGCSNLKIVQLSHNRLKTASGLETLTSLEHLDLGYNRITSELGIRVLSFCSALKSLVLEGNPIANDSCYRPSIICMLPHLLTIDKAPLPLQHIKRQEQIEERRGCRSPSNKVAKLQEIRMQKESDRRRLEEHAQIMNRRGNQLGMKIAEECHLSSYVHPHVLPLDRAIELTNKMARPWPRRMASESQIQRARDMKYTSAKVAFGTHSDSPKSNRKKHHCSEEEKIVENQLVDDTHAGSSNEIDKKVDEKKDLNNCSFNEEHLRDWIEDVVQEEKTAATALQVLINLHKYSVGGHGSKKGERMYRQRLSEFRIAANNAGIFEGSKPPTISNTQVSEAIQCVSNVKASICGLLHSMETLPPKSIALTQHIALVAQAYSSILASAAQFDKNDAFNFQNSCISSGDTKSSKVDSNIQCNRSYSAQSKETCKNAPKNEKNTQSMTPRKHLKIQIEKISSSTCNTDSDDFDSASENIQDNPKILHGNLKDTNRGTIIEAYNLSTIESQMHIKNLNRRLSQNSNDSTINEEPERMYTTNVHENTSKFSDQIDKYPSKSSPFSFIETIKLRNTEKISSKKGGLNSENFDSGGCRPALVRAKNFKV